MPEAGQDFALVDEAAHRIGIEAMARQQLDCDLLVEILGRVLCEEDAAHAAVGDLPRDPEVADLLADIASLVLAVERCRDRLHRGKDVTGLLGVVFQQFENVGKEPGIVTAGFLEPGEPLLERDVECLLCQRIDPRPAFAPVVHHRPRMLFLFL